MGTYEPVTVVLNSAVSSSEKWVPLINSSPLWGFSEKPIKCLPMEPGRWHQRGTVRSPALLCASHCPGHVTPTNTCWILPYARGAASL
jgi:hypothetical protein